MNSRKNRRIQYSDFTKQVTDQVQNADVARDEAMNRLQKIRAKRQKSQERQLGRIAKKYNGQHPRARHLARRISGEAEMEKYLALGMDRAKTDADPIDGAFVFKGRVMADDTKGLARHTVQLQDHRNSVIGKPVKTDKDGFYNLVLDVDDTLEAKKFGVAILDQEGTEIHKEVLPAIVETNKVEARDIIVTEISKTDRSIRPILKQVTQASKPVVDKKTTAPREKAAVSKKVVAKKAKKVAKKTTKKKAKTQARKIKKVATRKKITSRKKKR